MAKILFGVFRQKIFKKISATEIYFFDDAYFFDSSVFIGLYLSFLKLYFSF